MLRGILASLVVLVLGFCRLGWAAEGTVTILHTNDIQGRFHQMMKVGALKEQLEKETGAVILLDAGNTFAAYESAFEHPEGKVSPTVDLMNRIGYNAWTLGQVEVAEDALTRSFREAQFPILGANLHRPQNGRSLFQVQPYTVIRAGGLRVGVLGLGTGQGDVVTGDPVAAARYFVPMLRLQVDVMVLLTHVSHSQDSTLAADVPGVDLIVGTYSDAASAGAKKVNGVPLRQAGLRGDFAGRMDVHVLASGVDIQNVQMMPLDVPLGSVDAFTVALSAWTLPVGGERLSVTASLGTCAGGFGAAVGQAGAMGYLVADLMRSAMDVSMAFVSALSLDSELPEGTIRVQDLYRIYPAEHRVAMVEIKGEDIQQLLENGLDDLTQFFYPSGVQIVYDLTKMRGQRLVSVQVNDRPLDLRKSYKIAVEDGLTTLEKFVKQRRSEKIRDLLAQHIQSEGVIQGRLDNRMQEP